MDRTILGGLAVAAGLGVALLAQQSISHAADNDSAAQQQNQAGAAGQNQSATADKADSSSMAKKSADEKFAACASRNNLFEIQAAKLVAGKVKDEKVKRAAQMMIDDHTKAQEQLRQAAQKSSVQVPENLEAWQQAKLAHLSQIPAEDLASLYSFHLVAAHHMAILETQCALTKLQKPELKQFATQMERDLQGHLQQANGLAMNFTGGRSPSISGQPVSPDSHSQHGHDSSNQSDTSSQNQQGQQNQPGQNSNR